MHAPLSFTERMELGRDLAVARRNRGIPTGQHESWNAKPRTLADDDSWHGLVARARFQWNDKQADVLAAYDWDTRGRFGFDAWGVESNDIPF